MNAKDESAQDVAITRLTQDGVIRLGGADARAFLHSQLTNDIAHLAADRARRAGWCSAKGRLLATLLVVPLGEEFLLLLPEALVASMTKRLKMFVLRSKVTIENESADWAQYGVFGAGALDARSVQVPSELHAVVHGDGGIFIRVEGDRMRILAPADTGPALLERLDLPGAPESRWQLDDIRAGVPQVVVATQELFVPQMVNFEAVAGLDFKKGCYPGQEVVARAQYRGAVKRHMRRAHLAGAAAPAAGQDLYCDDQPGQPCGTVVASAATESGDCELLAVVPIAASENRTPVRVTPGGAALEFLSLPYAA